MRPFSFIFTVIILMQFALFGCALGKKEWPAAKDSDDAFTLELIKADRQDKCLLLEVAIKGAANRLYRASVQYEVVGGSDGEGCIGCPFVPRDVVHFTRDQREFMMASKILKINLCNFDPAKEYRFRVAGKSELPTSPIVYTDVYVTTQ